MRKKKIHYSGGLPIINTPPHRPACSSAKSTIYWECTIVKKYVTCNMCLMLIKMAEELKMKGA